ncbi:MAG: hypothetical protein ABMA64_15715 [Myxococcota bacterium]
MRAWVGTVVLAMATGCVVYKGSDDTGVFQTDGEIQLTWQVGSTGCEGSEVDTVQVDLGGFVDSFACADGGATMSAPAGTYTLSLAGLDAGGVARYGGDGGTVTVVGGQTYAAPTVVLSALPATISATWRFDNGALCSSNGVQDVDANLFDADDTLQASMTVPCDSAMLTLEDVEAGDYVLLLLGRDVGGTVVYSGEGQVGVERGDMVTVDVVLAPE